MYTNMRENALSFVFLALVGLLLTGCLQASQAGELPTMTPRPTQALSGSVQAGELQELVSVNEQIRDVPISKFQMNGDVALIVGKDGERTNLVAINLRNGEIADLDESVLAGNWLTTERYFAWVDSEVSGNTSIERVHVYDVQTGERFVVGENNTQRWPDVSESIIVWAESRGSRSWDIYAYDISSHQLTPVISRPLIQAYPKIAGEWIVYLENESTDSRDVIQDLYLHNLVTGEDMLIGPSPYASKLEGDTYGIDNGRVVWKGWAIGEQPTSEGPLPTLHVYDLETRTESSLDLSPVCTSVPVSFKMAGDLILFSCEGFYGCYDLAQEIFVRVPHPEHWSGYTYLSETYVVFRVSEKEESIWDYMTPGASPMPPEEHWLTPQPRQYRLFVVPITR